MQIAIITRDFYKGEGIVKKLTTMGHNCFTFYRDYNFEMFVGGIEPTIDKSIPGVVIVDRDHTKKSTKQIPKIDMVITDGTCKTRSRSTGESYGICYKYPEKWANQNSVPVASFGWINMKLWFAKRFPLFGLSLKFLG